MGMYYKTSSANPLDYMYQMNVPLMEKVITANDSYITQNLQQAEKLDTAASSFSYLSPDDKRAKEISDSYTGKIDAIANAIKADPANWRKHIAPMTDISRKLQSDYKTGEISKIANNYSKYKELTDYLDKATDEYNKTGKGISADRARAYKEYFLNNFSSKGTSYNPETGEYNAMNTFNPMNNIDIRKTLGDELEKLKADKNKFTKDEITGEEKYFNEVTKSWEGVTPERILKIVTDRLHDPQLMDYMKQDSQVGILNNVFDKSGNLITPYGYSHIPATPEEQSNIKAIQDKMTKTKDPKTKAQLQSMLDGYTSEIENRSQLDWNNQSYLAPIMRGLVEQYSYNQTENSNKLKNNSVWNTKFTQGQENFRQGRTLAQQKELAELKEKGLNDRFKATQEEKQWEFDHPHQKTATGKVTATPRTATTNNATTTTTAKTDSIPTVTPVPGVVTDSKVNPPVLPSSSTLSEIATKSYADWKTTDFVTGKEVPVLSPEGLTADISTKKKQLEETTTNISSIDNRMKSMLGNRKVSDLSVVETPIYNSLRVKKEALEAEVPGIQSELTARRKWYEYSVNAALTNSKEALQDNKGDYMTALSPEEIALYKKYDSDRQGEKVKKSITDWYANTGKIPKAIEAGTWDKMSPAQQEQIRKANDENYYKYDKTKGGVRVLEEELSKYREVKDKVDKMRENYLAKIRYTPIKTDAIDLGKEDASVIAPILFKNTQGVKFFDNGGFRADKISIGGKTLDLSGADDYTKLSQTLLENPNIVPVVQQIGNTTDLGSGNAIAKVVFTDKLTNKSTPPLYVEMTPNQQKDVAARLSVNSNPDIVKVANTLSDDEANSIRRQLLSPTTQITAGSTSDFDPAPTNLAISRGNQTLNFEVKKFITPNGIDHLVITVPDNNGVQIPVGAKNVNGKLINDPNILPSSGIAGWFKDIPDAIEYFKTHK